MKENTSTNQRLNIRTFEFLLFFLFDLFVSSFFWNKTLAVSLAGWFEHYAQLMNDGHMPYRDFYLFTTPLFPMAISLIFKIFGPSIAVSFAFGAVTRALSAAVLFTWLRSYRLNFAQSFIVVAAASMISKSDTGETINYYNQFCILFVILSGFCFDRAYQGEPARNALLGGALACAALITKQTIGLIWITWVFLSFGALFLLTTLNPAWTQARKKVATMMAKAGIGAVIVGGTFSFWLWRNGAFTEFIDQVFISGPKSKGDIGALLRRPLEIFQDETFFIAFEFSIIITLISFARLWRSSGAHPAIAEEKPETLRSKIAAILLIAALAFLGFHSAVNFSLRILNYAAILAGLWVASIAALLITWRLVFKRKSEDFDLAIPASLFVGMTFASVLGLTISFAIYEPMAMPTITGLFTLPDIIERMKCLEGKTARENYRRTFAALLCILFLNGANFKAFAPFDWGKWREPPIRESAIRLASPALGAMQLSPMTSSIIDEIVTFIQQESRSATDVLAYPHMPLFYFLTHKHPVTFGQLQFVDVTPDNVLDADIQRLRNSLPRIIIMMPLMPADVDHSEKLFREGKVSGVRRMNDFILSLRDQYEEKFSWKVFEGRLLVWLKKEN